MRNIAFIVFFILLTELVHGQGWEIFGRDTVNKVDGSGKKQDKWVLLGKHKPGTCYMLEQKAEEGKYLDNKKVDRWLEYYCNGNMKNQLTFVNGRPDGYAKLYHENGKISEEGMWKNNRWMGNYKLYYPNGVVQHEFVFNANGKREGVQKYYYENGQLAIEGAFANGKESGLIKEYYENGDLKAEKNYLDGAVDLASIKEFQPKKPIVIEADKPLTAPVIKVAADEKPNEAALKKAARGPLVLNGQYTLYNKNKQISKDGVFKDNQFIEGKSYMYDENGILTRVAVYKNGMYVGDTQVEN
jgi:antitoxin component YwqK of YwqJK toxin-antitoxin module